MMLSRACQYGILLTIHLAVRGDDGYLPVHFAAADLGLSAHFLAKIVQQMAHAGLVKSYRGPHGGVALGSDPDSIRLRDVVQAIDGMEGLECCALGLPGCGEEKPCPLHDAWSVIRVDFVQMLERTTLGDLARRLGQETLRLSSLADVLEPRGPAPNPPNHRPS
jgi:Rrf2 family transcriptional regulator, iron-sulfur cluster assembly transcription factor